MQRFQLGPLLRLGFADEGEDRLGEDRAFAVEALAGDPRIPVLKQVRLDDGLEGSFVRTVHGCCPKTNRARSRRSISYGVMHFTPRPMQASGILILRVEAEGISCVTTVCLPP